MATYIPIVRTWKRDGSVNVMDIRTAVGNLKRFHQLKPESIIKKLQDGEALESPLAYYALSPVSVAA